MAKLSHSQTSRNVQDTKVLFQIYQAVQVREEGSWALHVRLYRFVSDPAQNCLLLAGLQRGSQRASTRGTASTAYSYTL